MIRRFVTILGAMLIAVGCATNWVHPDPDADWDAAYADCSPKDEAANGGETNEQAMKDCLEAKGWVEQQTSKPPQRRRYREPQRRLRRIHGPKTTLMRHTQRTLTWGSFVPIEVNLTECLLSDIAENEASFAY
jgi:hypothetical protein